MDRYSEFYNEQINELAYFMQQYTNELKGLLIQAKQTRAAYESGAFVDYTEPNYYQHRSRILAKKIQEYQATIQSLSDKIQYELSDFGDSVDDVAFFVRYRNEFVEVEISDVVSLNEELEISCTVMNSSLSTWLPSEVELQVKIYNEDKNETKYYKYPIETGIETGETIEFNIAIPDPLANLGAYFIRLCMVKGDKEMRPGAYEETIYVTKGEVS